MFFCLFQYISDQMAFVQAVFFGNLSLNILSSNYYECDLYFVGDICKQLQKYVNMAMP
jgi:hypothetical protein